MWEENVDYKKAELTKITKLFSNQIATRGSAQHPQQRGGAPHGPPAPTGPDRHQLGDHRRREHTAADHRGQFTETMTGHRFLLVAIHVFFSCILMQSVWVVYIIVTLFLYYWWCSWMNSITWYCFMCSCLSVCNQDINNSLFCIEQRNNSLASVCWNGVSTRKNVSTRRNLKSECSEL